MDVGRHDCLASDLARSLFAGRAAIWGAVVPLAGIVVAWCAILVAGDEDTALEFGSRWGEWYWLWLFGLVIALAARGVVPVVLAARRRRRRIADVHAALARCLGREGVCAEGARNPLTTTAAGIVLIAIILAIAAPSVNGGSRTPLWDFFGVSLFVAGLALAVWKAGNDLKACEARRHFDAWKARREARRAERGAS